MSRVDVILGGKNAGFKKMLGDSRAEAKRFGSGVVKSLNLGNAFSATNLGAQLVGGVRSAVSGVLSEFDRIGKISLRVDIDPSRMQRYGVAAQLAGSDIEKLNDGLSDMVKNGAKAEAGQQGMIDEFNRLGLSVEEFSKLSTEEKFLAIADGLSKATDKAGAYNSASAIMGESARELYPLLQLGAEGIRNMVDEMDSASAADFESIQNFNDQLTVMENKLKVSAGQSLPVFFATMTTGWNAVSAVLRVVAQGIALLVGGAALLFNSDIAWGDKWTAFGEMARDANKMLTEGVKEDMKDISDSWSAVGGAAGQYSEAMREAQRETGKLAEKSEQLRAREEVARERAAKASERDAVRARATAERVGKERLAMNRKLVKKQAEMDLLRARAGGDDEEVKRLERGLVLWDKYLDYNDRLKKGRVESLALAKDELALEEKIAGMQEAQLRAVEEKNEAADRAEGERDEFTSLANRLSGGVDSLQSIGLGVAGVRSGESREVVELRRMAVERNGLLKTMRDELVELELNVDEARF